MKERQLAILKTILSNPSIKRKELEEKMGLSKEQIKYAINKINELLEENDLPIIQRTTIGGFVVEASVAKIITKSNLIEPVSEAVFYAEDQRIIILTLLLLNEPLDLSLNYFSYELKVSKNTVLRDISKLRKKLAKYSLEINYSRMHGYSIYGNELIIRDFLKETLFETIKMSMGLQILTTFAGVRFSELKEIKLKLSEIEKELKIRFTDEQYRVLPFFLSNIFRRIKQGKTVKKRNSEDEADVLNLDEVKIITNLLSLKQFGKRETVYISLHILSSNIISADFVNETTTAQLRNVLIQCICNFELKTLMDLRDKETILNNLMFHLTPAYYRMKYRINEKNEIYEKEFFENIMSQYHYLNNIINDCFKPLEVFLEVPLPEVEIMYISLIFGSKILPQGNTEYPKVKTAIVICPKGTTYSQLMLSQLLDIFPEIYFYDAVSHRAFQESNLKVDIIFSIGNYHDYANCFVVKATMNEKEKQQLRSKVFKYIFGVDTQYNLADQIMMEISSLIPEKNKLAIKNKVVNILGQNHLSELPKQNRLADSLKRLSDFLTEEKITICETVSDYKEAIHVAGQPLIDDKTVTPNYIKKVIESHDFNDPYTILGEQLAIPHAEPKDGVKKIGMSLLIIKEGVQFSKCQNINIIFLLAPMDKRQHNQAILDILTISESKDWINQLLMANTETQVMEILNEISE